MNKNLFIVACLIFMGISVNAMVTDEEIMSAEYITNHGYSSEMARLIKLQDAQINGNNLETTYAKQPKGWLAYPPGSWVRAFFIYIDPSYDQGDFGQHDSKFNPSTKDL
jgi:hypothetical protein